MAYSCNPGGKPLLQLCANKWCCSNLLGTGGEGARVGASAAGFLSFRLRDSPPPPSYLLLMDGVLRVWAGAAHVDGSLSGPYLRSPSSHPLSPLSSLHSSSLLLCTLTQLGPAPRPAGPLLRSYIRRIDASNQGLIIKDLLKKGPKANWTHRCG